MATTTRDEIIALERAALERWGNGDPSGFLELYAPDVTYFDPLTATRIDGHTAMVAYYAPYTGQIHVSRFDMLNPQVVIDEHLALLTYNLVNYVRDAVGIEIVGTCWNSTVVFRKVSGRWGTVHSHWSFTRHPAFAQVTPEATERQA